MRYIRFSFFILAVHLSAWHPMTTKEGKKKRSCTFYNERSSTCHRWSSSGIFKFVLTLSDGMVWVRHNTRPVTTPARCRLKLSKSSAAVCFRLYDLYESGSKKWAIKIITPWPPSFCTCSLAKALRNHQNKNFLWKMSCIISALLHHWMNTRFHLFDLFCYFNRTQHTITHLVLYICCGVYCMSLM